MKLSLIPAPYKIEYLQGFSKADAEITYHEDSTLPSDGFTIEINGTIKIGASSDSGFFYAKNTLEQIKFQCGQNLPDIRLKDIPRYSYRAFMIDSCRHFQPVSEIKKMIDYCAKMRFNVFHWHLTDDQGWRAEIKAYPELTKIGSVRHGSHFRTEQNEEDYGGCYTQDEMREIVKYAHDNFMSVVPEIDMPGHSSAMLASIPSIVCGDKAVQLKTEAGIFKDIICAGSDETYDVIYDILIELCDIFTDEYIHLGGDEAPKTQWKECPVCQEKMKKENLADEEKLQGYFINRINKFLSGKGKRVITWNESLNGGNLDEDITIQMWMDPKKRSKNAPNKIINSDFFHLYADYPYSMTPLKKVYEYSTDINSNVIGIDIPIWTEYVFNSDIMEYMCFPRFIAAACLGWCIKKPPYAEFKKQLCEIIPWYGFSSIADPVEWDPSPFKKHVMTIKHFGSISKNERVREFFLKISE